MPRNTFESIMTPVEPLATPNMDRVAMEGRQGVARTVPEGFESGSDVAIMTLLGYDPKVYHTGRAPLEAAAQRIPLSRSDWVFRCNLVTVVDGVSVRCHLYADRPAPDVVPATDLPAFGAKRFAIPFDARGKAWVRFAVWDSAGNGAFVQPVFLSQKGVQTTSSR